MTALLPSWEFVELCARFRLIGVPSSQTPQVLEVVAPLSVPRKTFFMGGIGGVFLAPAREKETSKKPDSPLQASH
jgi:hypothetical protein